MQGTIPFAIWAHGPTQNGQMVQHTFDAYGSFEMIIPELLLSNVIAHASQLFITLSAITWLALS